MNIPSSIADVISITLRITDPLTFPVAIMDMLKNIKAIIPDNIPHVLILLLVFDLDIIRPQINPTDTSITLTPILIEFMLRTSFIIIAAIIRLLNIIAPNTINSCIK